MRTEDIHAGRDHDQEARAGRHLVLYDGVCGLCNRLTAFLLRRDTGGLFVFASLQSATGQSFLRRFAKDGSALTTFYVVTDYRAPSRALLSKSRAALFVLRSLGGPWRWLGLFRAWPTALLDAGYDLVARHRYRWFGRYETCLLPSAAYKHRFIDL